MVALRHRSYPYPSPFRHNRLPRKAIRRISRDIALSCAFLLALVLLLRIHPNRTSKKKWPEISPRRQLDELKDVPRNIYYLNTEDVMYCYIPKNACSRFKPLFRKREGFSDWADPKLIHGKRNGLQRLMWLSKPIAMRRLKDRTIKKFVVVRDPFSRLASAYQNKIASPWPDQRNDFWNKHLRTECPGMIKRLTQPADGPLLTLEQFLECLLSTDNTEPSNEHWRPQTQLCGLDFIKYEQYLHLETLAEDAVQLLDFLQWRENTTAFQIHRTPVYSRDLAEYFSDRSLALALQYYEDDFAILQYPRVPSGQIDFYSVFDGTNFQPGFVPPVDFQPPTAGTRDKT